jgi:hypothetical protein
MTDQAIRIEKLTPHVGAEVRGVDLAQPLDARTFQQVHDALIDNGVIFFRDQRLTPEQQKAFGRRFGELHTHPAAPSLLPGHPEILVIHADETSRHVAGEDWHSDVSCDPEPPMGSILYITELPPVGGDTLFASMYAAYDGLSEPMKRLLLPLTAMHEGEHVYRGRYGVKDEGKVFQLHDAHLPACAGGERRAAPDALPPRGDAGVPVPVPLAGAVGGVLGQPLRPAPRDVGLLPAAAARQSGDDPRRQAVRPAVSPAGRARDGATTR